MSQWVHFLGVIRFDSVLKVSVQVPEPPLEVQDRMQEIVESEVGLVNSVFCNGVPFGSEGPLEIETILTNRGPTVVITGDLRDFHKKDLDGVVTWLNNCDRIIYDKINNKSSFWQKNHSWLWVRDAIVRCEVEYDENTYIIQPDEDGKFMLEVYPTK